MTDQIGHDLRRYWGRLQLVAMVWRCGLAILLTAASGCLNRPLRVEGQADAKINANVNANVDLSLQKRPVRLTGLPHPYEPTDPCRFIAVLDVDGILLDANATGLGARAENPVALFREQLDTIAADHRVAAVIVRIHSPGGSVTASDIMWRDLRAFRERTRRPVVACLMDVAAGGAYYVASASDVIVAHPTSVVGGIGCVLNVYNLQDLMATFNIVNVAIKSGNKIDLGSPVKALDEENRQLLQDMANEFHRRFREIVVQARPAVNAQDPTVFDGRVFSASRAQQLNLIDKVGYFDDAVETARQLGGAPKAQLVFLRREGDEPMSNYSITPNVPLQDKIIPLNIPGLDRTRLPCFLYMWMVEPSAEKLFGQ
ncbi:MAG: signal peptide peptidase SppA, type [Planctomycetaceae bacterium]|nr:signal peptide peptidase SppA, type [Planctomycetaceae bacterium]